jgi:hypothetical protein
VIYQGRSVNVVALWGEYVQLPANLGEPLPTFLPKVQCPNPDHDTHKHHFQINSRKPFVHCFGACGISGTYEHALCIVLGIYVELGVTEEMVRLAKTDRRPKEPAHIVTARERVGAAHRRARRVILKASRVPVKGEVQSAFAGTGTRKTIHHDDEVAKDQRALDGGNYTFLPKEARAYLDKRGVTGASRGKWRIGWDEETDRLVIPVYDDRAVFRFLIRQRIDGRSAAKYLYTDGSVRTSLLFGLDSLDREAAREKLILCEGPLDAIRLHQLGFSNAVAVLGSGLSKRQVRLIDKIGPKRVYLFFDRDAAGFTYIENAKTSIHKRPLYVCRYRNGKSDPGEMTREEVERSIERAVPIHQFFRMARSVKTTRRVTRVG